MGCCMGKTAEVSPVDRKEEYIAPSSSRKCRDLFWLVLYIVFMIGMALIGVFAFIHGDLNKIMYGIDSMGNICGSADNSYNGTDGPDLTSRTQLYYLDPSQLWDAFNLPWAKTVCVESCPQQESYCDLEQHTTGNVCTSNSEYQCPYYFGAEKGLYGYLPDVEDPYDTQYYAALANVTQTQCDIGQEALGDFGGFYTVAQSSVASINNGFVATACGQYYQATSQAAQGPCYPVFSKTVSYLNRCYPDATVIAEVLEAKFPDIAIGNSSVVDTISSGVGTNLQLYLTDLYRGSVIIIGIGVLGAIILSILWMIVLRYMAGCMAWTAVILVNIVFIVGTILCFQKAGKLGVGAVGEWVQQQIEEQGLPSELNPAEANQKAWEIGAWVAFAGTILLMIFTIIMIRRINIAVSCLKVASQAVASSPSILIFPLLPLMLEMVFLLYWIAVCALLYSSGDIVMKYRGVMNTTSGSTELLFGVNVTNITSADQVLDVVSEAAQDLFLEVESDVKLTDEECYEDPNCAYRLDWNTNLQYVALYHLFGLLWTIQFIEGYGQVVIAGVIANFYFYSQSKSRGPRSPLCSSMWSGFKAFGSIALGSLIVAIIQFVRFILEYIDQKTKTIQDTNPVFKYIMCCLKCCVWYFELVMKFINRNAYIMVAIKGTSYCTSAGRAFTLIVTNVFRVAVVNTVGDALIFLAKLTVVGGCGVSAFFLSGIDYHTSPNQYPDSYLSSPMVPVIGTCLCAYFIATLFFHVYEMAVDTILLSFCEDCDSNGGIPQFAPDLLMKTMGAAVPTNSTTRAPQPLASQVDGDVGDDDARPIRSK